nr:uncharacterized protein LOC111753059 [Loxodonta africana]
MVGARPRLAPRPPASSRTPLGREGWVGGRAGAHLGPSSQGSLAGSGTRAQKGGRGEETRRGPATASLALLSLSMGARRQPCGPAPGPRPLGARPDPPERWEGGGGGKMRAQSPVRGGELWGVRHLVSLSLPASSGACTPPPLPTRRGEGPLLAAAFAAFKFPWGPRLLPPPCRHRLLSQHRDAGSGWGKEETLLPANRRRRSRGLTKMAAAVSAATATTTATALYRYRRRGPSSRETQQR